ncbi:MAG: sodium ion-translocating decarboxylase subunit beta [Clostridia bacterium]|nr:sodium ion-translocating decarboxylase subunit beta [Clostridia bacterium]
MLDSILNFLQTTGIAKLLANEPVEIVKTLVMYVIIGALFYLAIVRKFEPLLLLPIAFGMLLANLPGANLMHMEMFLAKEINFGQVLREGGLIDLLYLGVKLGIYPSLIFMGVGAMTDFTALIANPKSLLIGAAAQLGVFVAFSGALISGQFNPLEAASIGIIGGADGPTAILVTKTLASGLLGAIAVAAYSYMALIPIIQPPFMRMLTTKKERSIVMKELRTVSQIEKVVFPILVTLVVTLIVPDAAPLIGFLMLGNLFNVCGVTDRLSKTAQNELINIITIFLGVSVGATANAENFLSAKTILIVVLGLVAFAISTVGGLLFAKLMCFITGGKINPLIGSAGVSAVPMAARVSQVEGQKANPSNFLLMHAMGPNVAGVIGSAVAAGVFLSTYSGVTLL